MNEHHPFTLGTQGVYCNICGRAQSDWMHSVVPSLKVTEGVIPNGADVYIESPTGAMYTQGRVMGYIPHTDAYLCAVGRKVQAYKAENVMRPVPKFNTIEEATAWLEGQHD